MQSSQKSSFLKSRTRRRFLKKSVAVGGAVAAPAIIGLSQRHALADSNTVRVIGPDVVALEDWSAFEAETGLTLDWTPIRSDPGVFMQEVIAGGAGEDFDLFLFDGGTEDKLGPDGHILPLDGNAMSRWGEVSDSVKSSPLLQGKDGTQYGAPVVFNADSFAYFPKDIDEEEPLSYKYLFDSEITHGKVSVENTWLTTFAMAGMYLKHWGHATIAEPSNMTAAEASVVADFLVERKKAGQFRALWSTWNESIDLMANGEVIVQNCWEPAVKALQGQGHDVRYAYTIEGYNKWMLAAYIPSQVAERDDLEKVYRAIDGFLGGAYGAQIAVVRGYATGNPHLSLEYAKSAGWSSEDIAKIEANIAKVEKKFAAAQFWQNASPDNMEAIESEWQRFVQA